MKNAIREALARPIDPTLLEEVLKAVDAMAPEDRGFEGTSIATVRILHERDVPDDDRVIIAMGISFRLRALAKLTADGGGRGWVLPGEPGADFVHEELLRCAAEEPLVEVEGEPTFDAGSFHRRLLALAETRGEA